MNEIPEKFQKIIDRVTEADRRYFQRHPEAKIYVRDYVKGEFFPFAYPMGTKVQVSQVIKGARLRKALSEEKRVHPRGRAFIEQHGKPREVSRENVEMVEKWLRQSNQ